MNIETQADIAEIGKKYSMVRESIEQLPNNYVYLIGSLNMLDTLRSSLEKLKDDEMVYVICNKFNRVLEKNPMTCSINPRLCNSEVCENGVFQICKHYFSRRRTANPLVYTNTFTTWEDI